MRNFISGFPFFFLFFKFVSFDAINDEIHGHLTKFELMEMYDFGDLANSVHSVHSSYITVVNYRIIICIWVFGFDEGLTQVHTAAC